jgi:hypothetical protein
MFQHRSVSMCVPVASTSAGLTAAQRISCSGRRADAAVSLVTAVILQLLGDFKCPTAAAGCMQRCCPLLRVFALRAAAVAEMPELTLSSAPSPPQAIHP